MIDYGGAASRQRANEKLATFLTFMIRHEITNRLVVSELLGLRKSAAWHFVGKLIEAELVRELSLTNLPTMLIHLTAKGLDLARVLLPANSDLLDITVQTAQSRIAVKDPTHTLLVQHTEMRLRRDYPHNIFRSEREVDQLELAPTAVLVGKKVPDLIRLAEGTSGGLLKIAVEVQQTIETPERRERVLSVYGHLIGDRQLWGVQYISTSRNILDLYRKQLLEGPRPFHREHIATTAAGKKIFDYVVVNPGMANPPVTPAMLEKNRFMFRLLDPSLMQHYSYIRKSRKSAPRAARQTSVQMA